MHWVENTQYRTVHGGKTQRRGEFLTGLRRLTLIRGKPEVSAAEHGDIKASGTISTYFRGAGGAIYYPEQKTGGLSVTLMCKQLQQESTAGQLLP